MTRSLQQLHRPPDPLPPRRHNVSKCSQYANEVVRHKFRCVNKQTNEQTNEQTNKLRYRSPKPLATEFDSVRSASLPSAFVHSQSVSQSVSQSNQRRTLSVHRRRRRRCGRRCGRRRRRSLFVVCAWTFVR